MKKLMSLGCLMALIFAGASAFAEQWFGEAVDATPVAGWKIGDELVSSWGDLWVTGHIEYKNWTDALTFEADKVSVTGENSADATVITSLKFTAIDGSELEDGVPVDLKGVGTDAKAGLTVVEKDNAYSYWGLYKVDNNVAWVQLTGAEPDLERNVTVKIALCKYGDGAIVKYSVGDVRLWPVDSSVSVAADSNASFQTIEFLGNCPAIASLNGQKFANGDDAKESINTGATAGGEIPTTIQVSRTDLLERGIDPDNATAVKNYLTTKQTGSGKNGQYGWVNVALGIDDTNVVAVAETQNTATPGEVKVNFGFVPDDSSTIQYVVDDAKTPTSEATISTAESGIHTVKVTVSQEGGSVEVVTEQVGVMNTGKDTSKMSAGAKTFDIVAVPFEAFKGQVTIANVLNTAELTVGDTLYVLTNGVYDTYQLKAGKVWEAIGETSYSREKTTVSKVAPENYYLTPGQAIWIERDANSKIVFTGKGEISESHSWTWKSEYGEYSLVANPTVNPVNIGSATFGNDGDMIIIEDVNNPKQYEKVGEKWGEWVTTTKTVRGKTVSSLNFKADSSCTIPGGIGFWYYNAKKLPVTINFGTNAKSVTVD